MTGRGGRQGVALMLVLWAVVVLAGSAAAVAATTRERSALTSNLRARLAARYAAESGVVLARARLERLLADRTGAAERAHLFRDLDRRLGDLRERPLGSARFTVAVVDLSARLDLNYASELMLEAFFGRFVEAEEARRAAATVADWRDRDDEPRPHGAEAAAYRLAGSPFVPANGPFARLDELPRVLGVSADLARRVAPLVTVRGDARINLNTAPPDVLAALPGVGDAGARALRRQVEAGAVFGSSAPLATLLRRRDDGGRSPDPGALSRTAVVPTRLLLISRGWLHGHPLTYEVQAVFALSSRGLELKDWTERER